VALWQPTSLALAAWHVARRLVDIVANRRRTELLAPTPAGAHRSGSIRGLRPGAVVVALLARHASVHSHAPRRAAVIHDFPLGAETRRRFFVGFVISNHLVRALQLGAHLTTLMDHAARGGLQPRAAGRGGAGGGPPGCSRGATVYRCSAGRSFNGHFSRASNPAYLVARAGRWLRPRAEGVRSWPRDLGSTFRHRLRHEKLLGARSSPTQHGVRVGSSSMDPGHDSHRHSSSFRRRSSAPGSTDGVTLEVGSRARLLIPVNRTPWSFGVRAGRVPSAGSAQRAAARPRSPHRRAGSKPAHARARAAGRLSRVSGSGRHRQEGSASVFQGKIRAPAHGRKDCERKV